ncbi:MFS transporter [Paenibacillus sp. JX-17]|uniref:MFS transporter n=1 Tax=Paenibacillus lacisoli TaxID=3064525 RepID=A0ABT9CG85_9BACL|nr:MFS transporter [Paenibacillus sp. JX-17]MDO7908299.1 MFS transporter [Paenibacillus sp. JX-17]
MKQFTWASYALYLLAGLVITTIGSVMPQLLEHYNRSYTDGGQLVFAGSVGFMAGVPISAYILKKFGEKVTLSAACIVIALSQFAMLALPPFGWVTAINLLNSIGASSLEVVVASLMMEMFIGRRAVVMSYLEVSFGLGALLMPFVASFFIKQGSWQSSLWVTGILAAVLAVVWMRLQYRKEETDITEGTDAAEAAPPAELSRRSKGWLLTLFLLMIFLYCGIEGSLNNFLSSIFVSYFHAAPSSASISIGLFWVAMVIGRLATGWIIRRINYSRFLMGSMLLTLVAVAALLLLDVEAAGYIFVTMLGLTLSGVYSITMVYANHSLPGMARLVTVLITGCAGFGGALFPALLGYVLDHAEPAASLWLIGSYAAGFIVLLLGVMAGYRHWSRQAGAGQASAGL